jgi:hypothetical protein
LLVVVIIVGGKHVDVLAMEVGVDTSKMVVGPWL